MDNNHKLIGMHYESGSFNGYQIATIISMNFITTGFMQIIVGIISFVFMSFQFLKQVKNAGGFQMYYQEWKDLLNLFKPNAKNDKGSD